MNTTTCHRDYDGSIIHDAEDSLYHGKILDTRDTVIYHGYTSEEAKTIFQESVDDYLSFLEERGITPPVPFASYSASFTHALLVKAALYAHEHHIDIDEVIETALSEFLERAAE